MTTRFDWSGGAELFGTTAMEVIRSVHHLVS